MNKPIYIVGGSKGGVGKSLVSMALTDYYTVKGQDVLLIETDTSNPDVAKCYADSGVTIVTADLDTSDGWIEFVNAANDHPNKIVIVNTAARNNRGVSNHGGTLLESLKELKRDIITLWIISRNRDCLELLHKYAETMQNTKIHVVRNNYFGSNEKFELYNNSNIKKTIEAAGGFTLSFPELADRVTDDLYGKRMSIQKASVELPLGNRAELLRWRKAVPAAFSMVFEKSK